MLVESICIVLILGIMCFIFLRSGRKDYVLATAPLLILPLLHTLAYVVGDVLKVTLSQNVKAAVDVFGLAVAVALMGLVSNQLKTKKSKATYLLVCGGFTTLLGIIFIFSGIFGSF